MILGSYLPPPGNMAGGTYDIRLFSFQPGETSLSCAGMAMGEMNWSCPHVPGTEQATIMITTTTADSPGRRASDGCSRPSSGFTPPTHTTNRPKAMYGNSPPSVSGASLST